MSDLLNPRIREARAFVERWRGEEHVGSRAVEHLVDVLAEVDRLVAEVSAAEDGFVAAADQSRVLLGELEDARRELARLTVARCAAPAPSDTDTDTDKPIVVAIEGPDGSGKTTLANALRARLERDGRAVRHAALPSPGVVPWSALLSGASAGLPHDDPAAGLPPTPTTCLRHALGQGALAPLLLLLDCARAVEEGRRAPAGTIVLHDRSSLSTAVYQGPVEACLDLVGSARPDLVLLLTASEEALEERRGTRGDRENERIRLMDYRRAASAAWARGWRIDEIRTDDQGVEGCVDEALTLIERARSRL